MRETLEMASLALIVFAVLLKLVRLVKGPGAPDRLLAVETLSLGLVGLLVLRAGEAESRLYVDSALGLALFSFVATAVIAYWMERKQVD